jgi:hypothetical protein
MRAALIVLLLVPAAALAHPGHGMPSIHLHGFSPEMIVLALLVAAWALLRAR